MTDQRWKLLMNNDQEKLTQAEIDAGWHFCAEWDGLLVGPDTEEMDACTCKLPQKHLPMEAK
jgi:hypothetical protein